MGVALHATTRTTHGARDEHRRVGRQSAGVGDCRTDFNDDPSLPFDDASFDAAVCCVSVDYSSTRSQCSATWRVVVRPGGLFVCTFSNRCFPTKAVAGWLYASDAQRCAIVTDYFRQASGWSEPTIDQRTPAHHFGDPLYAVWSTRY